MTYEYLSNPAVDFGAQGFQGGLDHAQEAVGQLASVWRGDGAGQPHRRDSIGLFRHRRGPDYDYGLAFGGALRGTATWIGKGSLRVRGGGFVWLPVVSGFAGNHYLWNVGTELRGLLSAENTASASPTTGCGASAGTPSTRTWTRTCRRLASLSRHSEAGAGMSSRRRRMWALIGAVVMSSACPDSVVRTLSPDTIPR